MSTVASALPAVSVDELTDALQETRPPLVIDVRKRPAFEAAPDMIAGALRRDPADIDAWIDTLPAAHAVVVYCIHGREVSQSVARRLGERGIPARYLAGGIEAWKDMGGARDRKPLGASTRERCDSI